MVDRSQEVSGTGYEKNWFDKNINWTLGNGEEVRF